MKARWSQFAHSLAFRVGAWVILIEIALSVLTGTFYIHNFNAEVDRRITRNVLRPASLMNGGLIKLDAVTDARHMRELVGEELLNAYIVGLNGNVFYSLKKQYTGQSVSQVPGLDVSLLDPRNTETVVRNDGRHIVTVAPLFGPDHRTVRFFVYSEASLAAAMEQKAANVRLFMLGSVATVALTSIVVLMAFSLSVFAPLRNILEALHRLQAGDLAARVAKASARHEIGAMARSVNFMAGELERLLDKLRRERDLVAGLMDCSPVGITVVNRSGAITFVNARAGQLCGLTPAAMIGCSDNDPKWRLTDANGNPVPESQRPFRRVLQTGKTVYDLVYALDRRPELRVVLSINGAPLLDAQGQVEAVVLTLEDITQRQRIEAEIRQLNTELDQRVRERTTHLEAAIRELDSFAFSVSHDLRAPLRSIDGFSRILEEDNADSLSAEGRETIRTIRAAAQRMGRLIDAMLTLSRHARRPLHLAPVDLSAIATSFALELRKHDPQRNAEFLIEAGLTAHADADLLRAVLDNLLGNAWKFTAQQPQARIEFGRMIRDGAPTFFVRDNGCGFDMAYAEKLFRPFERLHRPADYPGTGVGLSNVQRIIQRHGGQVAIEGAVGRGATVYFTLEAKTVSSPAGLAVHPDPGTRNDGNPLLEAP